MLFQRFRKIGAAYQQAKRLRDIAGVLLKYGYDDLAQHLPLPRTARIPLRRVRDQQADMQQISQPERLRRACEELGPTFVKLGQLAAARTRILPPEFTDELAKLQDQVAPLPFSEVRAVIEEELKRPLPEVFRSVEEKPLGSASIAQVHRAKLLTGEEVVIKAQRPGIEKTVGEDLALLRQLASLAETHLPEWRLRQPIALVDELARSLEKEMDFTSEAAHLERFSWQFRDEATIYLPAVFLDFTIITQLARLAGKHQLRLPPDLVVMLKALSVTEELVRRLNPEHDLIAQAEPFMKRTRMERLRPRRMITSALEFAQELGETARELPNEVRRIVSQIKTGNARVNFRHEGLEPATNAFKRSTNRLSFALVVAALIISSSLIIHSKVPPLWGDVSVIGIVGYLLAGLMALHDVLFVSGLRERINKFEKECGLPE